MTLRDDVVVPALECRGLSKRYGTGRIVLAQLDFTLAAGEFVAIMGDSGVGKSTLLNLIAGLDRADSGNVLIDGRAVEHSTITPRRVCAARSSASYSRRFTCCRI